MLVLLLLAAGGQGTTLKEFKEGDTVTLSFPGDLTDGCKYMMSRRGEGRRLNCCYSASWRGEEWCDPAHQSKECRRQEQQEVKEVLTSRPLGNCTLRLLGGVNQEDSGVYTVMFPKWLEHNVKFEIKVTADVEPQQIWENILICVVPLVLILGILLIIFKKTRTTANSTDVPFEAIAVESEIIPNQEDENVPFIKTLKKNVVSDSKEVKREPNQIKEQNRMITMNKQNLHNEQKSSEFEGKSSIEDEPIVPEAPEHSEKTDSNRSADKNIREHPSAEIEECQACNDFVPKRSMASHMKYKHNIKPLKY